MAEKCKDHICLVHNKPASQDEGEPVNQWADRLAGDLVAAGELEYGPPGSVKHYPNGKPDAPPALTRAEVQAIDELRRLAQRWPQSLLLFASGGALSIRKGGHGAQHEVDYVTGIPNDGGDGSDEF